MEQIQPQFLLEALNLVKSDLIKEDEWILMILSQNWIMKLQV